MLLALLAAVFLAVGIVVRQRATLDVPAELGVSPVMFKTLIRRPLWWAGTGSAVAGFVFQALALINGSLLLVQPILVSALLFALPLSARMAHRRVTRGEWGWALLLTAALAVFVVLAKANPGDYEASLSTSAVVAVVCTAAVSACVLVATRIVGWARAVLLAVAVGVLFGVVAVLTKLVMHVLTHEGVAAVTDDARAVPAGAAWRGGDAAATVRVPRGVAADVGADDAGARTRDRSAARRGRAG